MVGIRRTGGTAIGGWLALLLPLVLGLTGCAIPLGPRPTATPQLFRSYREYHLRNPYPEDITAGPDGAVWFTEAGAAQIGRISPEGGITEFPIPAVHSGPWAITAGPDNAVWFTDRGSDQIGRITTAGKVTEFALGGPPYAAVLEDITAGPDGALWFTETTDTYNTPGHAIGRITPTGKVTQFLLPTLNASPQGITLGPDGALWFTESGASRIGRITPTGEVTEFPLPTTHGNPWNITSGPDGALWFTDPGTNQIGRITLAGDIREFPNPSGNQLWDITAAPDGALWFTEARGTLLGRITVSGVFSRLNFPTCCQGGEVLPQSPDPRGITIGPDGALWYTEVGVSVIIRVGFDVSPAPPTATTMAAVARFPGARRALQPAESTARHVLTW